MDELITSDATSIELTLPMVLGLTGDAPLGADDEIQIGIARSHMGDALFVSAMDVLAGHREPIETARARWESLLQHRTAMEKSLGRPVGIQVAAADFLYQARPASPQFVVVPHGTFQAVLSESRIDAKTGLSTQASFLWAIDHELRRSRRYKRNLVLVLVDLDDTGELNARRGPAFADFVLREVAGLIRQTTRVTDTAARLDEDVFGLLLPECKVTDARVLAERLRKSIEDCTFSLNTADDAACITASIGIAGYPRNASDADGLMNSAREILFRAKEMGKNRVEFE